MPDYELTNADLHRIYAALASEVAAHNEITRAGQTFRAAGLLPSGDQQHWAPLMQSIDGQFSRFSPEEKLRTIRVLAQRLMQEGRPETSESVKALLREHGFQYVGGVFVPVGFFDEREARYIPQSALAEISTALSRLVTGDPDGAVTSACSAVETAAAEVYRAKPSLGDIATEESFQRKAMNAITASGRLQELESELISIGWDPKDAGLIRRNLEGMLNQAAYVMQSLRSRMGDVHGAKPALESVVFDALKLASILVSLMK
jgi:hypothetical protein